MGHKELIDPSLRSLCSLVATNNGHKKAPAFAQGYGPAGKNAQKSTPSFFRGFSCLFVANQNLLSSRPERNLEVPVRSIHHGSHGWHG